jgi:hypothetical protein
MGHEDNSFGALFNGIFDGWEGSDDTLVVCDLVTVQWNVEINLKIVRNWTSKTALRRGIFENAQSHASGAIQLQTC